MRNAERKETKDKRRENLIEQDTVIEKQSQYKKTEPRMRLFLPSKLPIRGLKFIEKQIFYPCPFFLLADLWFSYAKLEANLSVK